MRFDLRRPCANCPFRTDVVPYLRTGRVAQLEREIAGQEKTFACHKTVTYADEDDDDDDPATTAEARGREQHCAGALLLVERDGRPHRLIQIAERLRIYDPARLDRSAPVYASWAAMRAAYARWNGDAETGAGARLARSEGRT